MKKKGVVKPPYALKIRQLLTWVCKLEGLKEGWQLRWTAGDSYCWRWRKTVDLASMNSFQECRQMLLHEIAHAIVVEPTGSQHTPRFFDALKELLARYAREPFDARQTMLAKTYAPKWLKETGGKCT